jgi:nitroreductase
VSFLTLAEKRQSVRRYADRDIPREVLDRCIEAARLAPSANNCQPWHFIVVDDPVLRGKIARTTFSAVVGFNRFTLDARGFAVVVTEKPNLITQIGGSIKNLQYNLLDVGGAVENFCLQAADEGLGSCILGWFDEKKIKDLLEIPKKKRIGLVVALGYPADDTVREKKRKPRETMSSYNRYFEERERDE